MKIIFRNMICHRRKNLIMLFTVIFSTVLVNVYIGNILNNQSRLTELADVTPIYCHVTNPTGSRTVGLEITDKNIDRLLNCEYVKDLSYTIRLNGCIGHIAEDEWYKLSYNITSVNSIDAAMDMTYDDITMAGGGGQAEKEAFFQSDENVVLLSKQIMEKNGIKLGDEIPLTIYYYFYDDYDSFCRPLDYPTVKVAGQMKQSIVSTDGFGQDILLPAHYVEKLYRKNDKRITMDSASFYLKDPLKINEAKQAFKDMYFIESNPEARGSYMGIALCIKDATFMSLAGNLLRNISILKFFLIPLCALMSALGALISFILLKNRQKEYFTMRLLGVYEYQCVYFYVVEGLILAVIGAFSGNIITYVIQKETSNILYSFLIIISCVLGCFTALFLNKKEMTGGRIWK